MLLLVTAASAAFAVLVARFGPWDGPGGAPA